MGFRRWFATGLLIILTFSFAASTGVMVVLREREESRRFVAEEALLQARRVSQELEGRLTSHKEKSVQLERELMAFERMNQFTLVRLKGLEKKLNHLQKQLTKEHLERQALAKERNALNHQLMLARSEKKSLRSRLNRLLVRSPKEVDLGQIVVSATPALEGKVLVVNPKFNFVVVNLGHEEELGIGTLLNVYRQGQFVGRVQVEQVREAVAACKILQEWTLQDIQEDDQVTEL